MTERLNVCEDFQRKPENQLLFSNDFKPLKTNIEEYENVFDKKIWD